MSVVSNGTSGKWSSKYNLIRPTDPLSWTMEIEITALPAGGSRGAMLIDIGDTASVINNPIVGVDPSGFLFVESNPFGGPRTTGTTAMVPGTKYSVGFKRTTPSTTSGTNTGNVTLYLNGAVEATAVGFQWADSAADSAGRLSVLGDVYSDIDVYKAFNGKAEALNIWRATLADAAFVAQVGKFDPQTAGCIASLSFEKDNKDWALHLAGEDGYIENSFDNDNEPHTYAAALTGMTPRPRASIQIGSNAGSDVTQRRRYYLPSVTDARTSISFSTWFFSQTITNVVRTIFNLGNDSTDDFIQLYQDPGGRLWLYNGPSSPSDEDTGIDLTQDADHYIAFSWDISGSDALFSLYIDGNTTAAFTHTYNNLTTDTGLHVWLMCTQFGEEAEPGSAMSVTRLWLNRVLTGTEFAAEMMSEDAVVTTGLYGNWKFDGDLLDSSGHSNPVQMHVGDSKDGNPRWVYHFAPISPVVFVPKSAGFWMAA